MRRIHRITDGALEGIPEVAFSASISVLQCSCKFRFGIVYSHFHYESCVLFVSTAFAIASDMTFQLVYVRPLSIVLFYSLRSRATKQLQLPRKGLCEQSI